MSIKKCVDLVCSKVDEAIKSATFAGEANSAAQIAADRAEAVVIPPEATYSESTIDSMISDVDYKEYYCYVDEINGSDSNNGTSTTTPLATISNAISRCAPGKKTVIIMLSDCSFNKSAYKNCITLEIRLNGNRFVAVKDYADSKAVLFAIQGYNNSIIFTGGLISGSIVELPELGDDTLFSSNHSVLIKSNGSEEAEISNVHFGYGVEIIDKGDFYISSCTSSICSFTFSSSCTFTADATKQRVVTDLVSGVVKDTNGVPRNILSNLIF